MTIVRREERRLVRKNFNAQSDVWRIEAVIHDGNWYDFDKWMKVAKVDEETLNNWIEENEDVLIKSELGSYRVGYDEIVRWYSKEDLDVEASLVPSNFPPKLWGRTTETDVFLSAPRRRVGTVSFELSDQELYNKIEAILHGVGKIMPDIPGRYKAHGLSASHMRNLMSKGLTEEEFDSLNVKTRAVIMQRELIDFPLDWLEEALDFYANTFAPAILRSSMSTISIYLPNRNDVHSQTMLWVIIAMKKFNENASVPFSGYLSNVLRHWPYDLPNEHLGKELAKFQRDRKKAIDKGLAEGLSRNKNVPIEVLAEIMDMKLEEYIELDNEHQNWLAEKNATALTWDDSANEKSGRLLGDDDETKYSKITDLAKLSLATVNAAIESEDWKSAFKVISQIDTEDIDENIGMKLSKEFSNSFKELLSEKS